MTKAMSTPMSLIVPVEDFTHRLPHVDCAARGNDNLQLQRMWMRRIDAPHNAGELREPRPVL